MKSINKNLDKNRNGNATINSVQNSGNGKLNSPNSCSKYLKLPLEGSPSNRKCFDGSKRFNSGNKLTTKCAWCQKCISQRHPVISNNSHSNYNYPSKTNPNGKLKKSSKFPRNSGLDVACQYPDVKNQGSITLYSNDKRLSQPKLRNVNNKTRRDSTKSVIPNSTIYDSINDIFNNSNEFKRNIPTKSKRTTGRVLLKMDEPHFHHCCFCESCPAATDLGNANSNCNSRLYLLNHRRYPSQKQVTYSLQSDDVTNDSYDENNYDNASVDSSQASLASEFSTLSI